MDGDVGGIGFGVVVEWCGDGGREEESGCKDGFHGYDYVVNSNWVVFS